MVKRRGSPDQRGMGAQSDFLLQSFVPDTRYKTEQIARAKLLLAAGFDLEQVAALMGLPVTELCEIKALAKA